jgi:hypothetical protein
MSWGNSVRTGLAILMALHGAAHSVEAWRKSPKDAPHGTTVLDGHIHMGSGAVRFVDALWLLTGSAFAIVAIATLFATSWWPSLGLTVAFGSLLLCTSRLPNARMGVVLNVVIIALLVAGRWRTA